VVLPRGSFGERRSFLNEKLGSLERDPSVMAFRTEDYESGWTRMFAAHEAPSTHIIDARGAAVWRQEGRVDAAALAAALDEHATPGVRPRSDLLRLAIQPGDRAPDVLLTREDGEQVALRKLRGQPVLLNFWKSWSSPCLTELRRLQDLHGRAGRRVAVIGINDGEEPKQIAEIRRTLDLTFPLMQDPNREIGRRYGVNCWPTTVSIGTDGRVDRVQFGRTSDQELARAAPPKKRRD
jgi:peroxiredoxin